MDNNNEIFWQSLNGVKVGECEAEDEGQDSHQLHQDVQGRT